ncbi:hypothetical protein POL68_25055 [Stigmatella sp. ncwal1]|uniref:Uncharacterized protein n=1 Tax=Stigmatella ashevillensis TaxID=2995309 RepID=A0ABT5DDK2_9BACT|nr:hypothetical protein [Stigmatella ashevillena]MDC0711762.1 hypothetical protein [Stigmatella ashevillena]
MGMDGVGNGRNPRWIQSNGAQPLKPAASGNTPLLLIQGGNTSQLRGIPPYQRDEFVGPQQAGRQCFAGAGATAQGEVQAKKDEENGFLDGLQTVLDVAGFVPLFGEVADIANAGISAARGNYLEAGLSLLSVIPGVGDAVGKGAKYALKFADAGAAAKALDLMKSADIPGFFNKLASNPQVAKYVEPLKKALDDVMQKLQTIAGGPQPQLAMVGGPSMPSGPVRNTPANHANMSSVNNVAGGAAKKRGDHVFNMGLQKLGLSRPNNQVLQEAFDHFQSGLKKLEDHPAFKQTVNKEASTGSDVNSKDFGEGLSNLRDSWAELNRVLDSPRANAQPRAAAVRNAVESMQTLRKSAFDPETIGELKKQMNSKEFTGFQKQVADAQNQLDKVFNDMTGQIERFMPDHGEIGQSMGEAIRRRR